MKLNPAPQQAPLTNPTLVACLALSPDGDDVVVGQVANADRPALSRWAVPSLTALDGITECPLSESQDTCNVLSRGGNLLAVAGISEKQLTLIDLESGAHTRPVDGDVMWARFQDGLLATGGTQAQIRDLRTDAVLWQQDPPAPSDPIYPSRAPLVAPHPDGERFAVGGSGVNNVRIFSLSDPRKKATVLDGAPQRLRWLGYNPGGTYLVGLDASVRSMVFWRDGERTPHLLDKFGENTPEIWSIAFHPDGEHCAVGMVSGVIRLYRLLDGERLDRQSQHLGRVQTLAFTPDGTRLLSGGDDGKLLLWTVV